MDNSCLSTRPAMVNDDLKIWLKAAAENKITAKNTWKATLIDHFSNIDSFIEKEGVNFQKASCTLDGCIKIYSTRVDDVSESAMRLMEGFCGEDSKDSTRKKSTKKMRSTIEKDVSNLNIKVDGSKSSIDPKFLYVRSLPESALLVGCINISSDGVLRMSSECIENKIIETDIDIPISPLKGLFITPSLSKYKGMENTTTVSTERCVVQEESVEFCDIAGQDNPSDIKNSQKSVPDGAPFTYFREEVESSCFKVRGKRTRQKIHKQERIPFLDFTQSVNYEDIAVCGDTLFKQSFILERRGIQHILHEDFMFEVKDLYKYIVKDGFFRHASEEHIIDVPDTSLVQSFVVDEPVDEFITDISVQDTTPSISLFPFRRVQKRVDIKRLKNSIFNLIEKTRNTTLSSLFPEITQNMYGEDESKDISIHLCIVSVLHLANERGVKLCCVGNDIEIGL